MINISISVGVTLDNSVSMYITISFDINISYVVSSSSFRISISIVLPCASTILTTIALSCHIIGIEINVRLA